MIDVILHREDMNTEFVLLCEWLVGDREPVKKGQAVCVVETSKATLEVESPSDGILIHMSEEGAEIEFGKRIAVVAKNE